MGKVTLKSLSGHFGDLGVLGSVGAAEDHKSGGSSEATSKASFPLHNKEARQHQGNLDVTSNLLF